MYDPQPEVLIEKSDRLINGETSEEIKFQIKFGGDSFRAGTKQQQQQQQQQQQRRRARKSGTGLASSSDAGAKPWLSSRQTFSLTNFA